jgi:CBS domain-containing protein
MTAGDVCKRRVVCARPETSVLDAVDLMKIHHVGNVVIVREPDGERVPIGILTDRDIALAVHRLLRVPHLTVADLMSAQPVISPEQEDLPDALRKMRAHGVRRLPVVNACGGIEGLVTFEDIFELLSEELTDLAGLVAQERTGERSERFPDM